jgi:hypothetical protein
MKNRTIGLYYIGLLYIIAYDLIIRIIYCTLIWFLWFFGDNSISVKNQEVNFKNEL